MHIWDVIRATLIRAGAVRMMTMLSPSEVELTERVRLELNKIQERDAQGNEVRFGWQLLAYLAGRWLMSSADGNDARIGRILQNASIGSFTELLGTKIGRWLLGN